MTKVEITNVELKKMRTVTLELSHVAGGRQELSAKSSFLTSDELKSYLMSLCMLSADGDADLVNDDTAWVVDVDRFPNPRDRFLQAAFMAREKAKADGGGTSEHDFVKWLWGTDPAEALDVTRTILTKSGNKLLEFVAKNMLKAAPAKQGQPKKFTEEISRAYFELAQERAASAAERFIPTNKEVYEKLKDFGVWVRTKGNSDSCPPGFKAVNQKTVETTCAKLRNRDEANPANRQQMYAMFATQRARQETLLKAKRNIQRELLLNPAVQKMMAAQDEALLDAEPMAPLVDAEYEALLNGERKALNAEPPGAEDQDCRK